MEKTMTRGNENGKVKARQSSTYRKRAKNKKNALLPLGWCRFKSQTSIFSI